MRLAEIVEDVPPLAKTKCFLIKPKEGLSTPAVFKELGLQPGQVREHQTSNEREHASTLTSPSARVMAQKLDGPDPRELLDQFQKSVVDGTYVNDLEPPAFRVMPSLKAIRDDLAEYGEAH